MSVSALTMPASLHTVNQFIRVEAAQLSVTIAHILSSAARKQLYPLGDKLGGRGQRDMPASRGLPPFLVAFETLSGYATDSIDSHTCAS